MEVSLRNKDILKALDDIVEHFYSIPNYNDPKYRLQSDDWDSQANPEFFCSEIYLRELLDPYKQRHHAGHPEQHMAHPVSNMVKHDAEVWSGFRDKCRVDFTTLIGAQHAALTNYYPPGGFVGWHTNWNAAAYQILFTWSKTGEGYFRYYDLKKDEVVTIEDKPGWQCRWYYFGRQDEPDHHCWHSAYTYCDRITLAFKFDNGGIGSKQDETAKILRDQCIEELESESV